MYDISDAHVFPVALLQYRFTMFLINTGILKMYQVSLIHIIFLFVFISFDILYKIILFDIFYLILFY